MDDRTSGSSKGEPQLQQVVAMLAGLGFRVAPKACRVFGFGFKVQVFTWTPDHMAKVYYTLVPFVRAPPWQGARKSPDHTPKP